MLKTTEIKLGAGEDEANLYKKLAKKAGGSPEYIKILKKSLDARDKKNIFWVYNVEYSLSPYTEPAPKYEIIKNPKKVAIIGSGPAGLFCALRLIDSGFTPVIIERGECVQGRKAQCENFFSSHKLDDNSNVQFGEGGAGAFSDGKLNTQTKDVRNRYVFQRFAEFGAPKEILYLNKPHIGSDNLYFVLQNIRKHILSKGGEYLFNTKFICLSEKGGALKSITLQNTKTGETHELDTDCAVLAIGHSARDTYSELQKCGIYMESREFAVGVRIEHLAKDISFSQYGESYPFLPTADYKLVSHAHERNVFTFCMCPGGVVIPSASEQGGLVINGMSEYKRDKQNSNSALMVQMKKSDFGGDDLFAGIRFQREIEQKAFSLTGDFLAPVQLLKDFAKDKPSSSFGEIVPSYCMGTVFAPLSEVLPSVCIDALKAAIPDMAKRLHAFDNPDAVLTGVETRFSSPVKIVRGESGESVSVKGLYPCGEGAGYSGGITSSCSDGVMIAEKIIAACAK